MKSWEGVLSLIVGIMIALAMNYALTPNYLSMIYFLFETVVFSLIIVLSYGYAEGMLTLRILFIGASIVSIIFAFYTFFFSITLQGLVQISNTAIAGLFKSILIASFFGLLERLAKFLEDKANQRSNIAEGSIPDYSI